jgi:signal transduction histidine kinase
MNAIWKNRRNWFLRLYDHLKSDIFAVARAKILVSYVVIGVIITVIATYLIYRNTLYITQDITVAVQQSLQNSSAVSRNAIADSTTQLIDTQIWKANLLVGLFMFLIIGTFAYVLARVTLRPIQRIMERQRRFAANVAHELRTPLSAMKTNFEVALMGVDEHETGEFPEALKSGIEEIDRMTAITHFLLTFSAFEGRRAELEFSDIDLTTIVHETLRRLEPIIAKRDVLVTANCPTPIRVRGNATALGELLMNLVKNALAYTPTDGSVVIATKLDRGLPLLSVSDTGIGIPPADLPNVFEPFYRGENAYSQRSQKRGSGLGLAIVREIVTLHKARISITSELGKGTSIFVRFPAFFD